MLEHPDFASHSATSQTDTLPLLLPLRAGAPARLRVGLLNNMPDAAFLQTERQFRRLLGGAAVELFVFENVERGESVKRHVEHFYRSHRALGRTHLDALVITGCEPRAPRLDAEPYYPAFTDVVEWARGGTVSTLFSCLAAHAAVLHLDGIERRPLPRKLAGVYRFATTTPHPLLAGMTPTVGVPHSRLNDLPENELRQHGYTLLRRSDEAGADLFLRDFGSLFVFLQGHPEYEPDGLAREYRRDVGRYVSGQRETYPDIPANYFPAETAERFRRFAERALRDRAGTAMTDFPPLEEARPLAPSWQEGASTLFRNWLALVERRRSPFAGRAQSDVAVGAAP